MLLAHRLVVVDNDTLGLRVRSDERTQGLADAQDDTVQIVILIAVEFLENAVVVEAESASDIAFANLLGLEGSDTNSKVVVPTVVLELPGRRSQ